MMSQLTARAAGRADKALPDLQFLPNAGKGGAPAWVAEGSGLADPTPLVVVHGVKRAAQSAAQTVRTDPAAQGRRLIAPLFSKAAWPKYQQVTVGRRADTALIGLLRELGAIGRQGQRACDGKIDLLGYSGGAQFAHRFAMLHPHLVRRLILVAAGWYTFPEPAPWPFGLGDGARWSALGAERLDEFLSLEIDVAVGALDTQTDPHLRRGDAIDRQQGTDRVARAARWVEALQAAAQSRGRPSPQLRLHLLPAAGHDFTQCVENGRLLSRVYARDSGAAAQRLVCATHLSAAI